MSQENKTWESVKESYLKQVEAAIRTAGHPRLQEILDDVNAHLEQKFAELAPNERIWENFQKIIIEMGPASDYAELLGEKKSQHAEMGIWRRFFVNVSLSIVIIATIILLCQVVDRLIPYYGKQVTINEPNQPGEFAVNTYMTLQGKYVDNLKYPFVDDPNVIGKWVSVDFVEKPEEFTLGQQRWQWGLFLKELQFFNGGTTQWGWQWTKGLLLSPNSHTASRYTIKTIDGEQYMFFEWKSGDYTILHRKPAYYVLKKEALSTTYPSSQPSFQKLQTIFEPNLIAYWNFDGNARDLAGSNDGTIYGANLVEGISGQAYYFDGKSDYVSIPTSPVFALGTGNFTISAWFKTMAFKNQFVINFRNLPDQGKCIEIYITADGSIGSYIDTESGTVRLPFVNKKCNDGQWHHIAITLDNGKMHGYKLFLDGRMAGGLSCSVSLGDWSQMAIGGNPKGTWNKFFFDGLIDEVAIYSKALSEDEIAGLYAKFANKKNTNKIETNSADALKRASIQIKVPDELYPGDRTNFVTHVVIQDREVFYDFLNTTKRIGMCNPAKTENDNSAHEITAISFWDETVKNRTIFHILKNQQGEWITTGYGGIEIYDDPNGFPQYQYSQVSLDRVKKWYEKYVSDNVSTDSKSPTVIDIKPSAFDIHLEPKRGICCLKVSIQNESKTVIPRSKLKFFLGDPNNNLDEAGDINGRWHEAGSIGPGGSRNERSRYFHLPDGEYEFNVVLDFDNAVPEIDESNNKAALKVKILDGQIVK